MATPLKSLQALLSPRIASPLSPLSPKLLSVPRKFENLTKPILDVAKRTRHAAKKLEFSRYASPKLLKEPVEIRITDYAAIDGKLSANNAVLINTPNKRDIFENGVEGNQNYNLLGVGSFGRVVRGIHEGKIVAVKVVRNTSTLSEKNALNLNHLNIVRTLEIIQNPESNFSMIIMEYFQNSRQLQTLLEDSDFEMEPQVFKFATDICSGLDYLHRKSILHLDMKPQNVLVAGNACKICDFGNSVLVTESGNFIHQGTVVYTAPELLQGKSPSEKCDIYSLGVLLWQLRTRCAPYSDIDNVETVIYKVVKCNCRPDNSLPRDDYSKLYQNCWDADPNNRPAIKNIYAILKQLI